MKVGHRLGDDELDPGGTVACNTIFNISQDGISIYTSEVLVDANEVYGSESANGAIYVCEDGYDNDCNGLVDKEDDACKTSSGGCGCSETGMPGSRPGLLHVIIQLLF